MTTREGADQQQPQTTREKIAQLRRARLHLQRGGGRERIARQHETGKLTARERIDLLLEKETFQELFLFARHRATAFGMAGKDLPGEGVVTGCGTVVGRQVFVAAQDFTVAGGSVGETQADKICQTMDLALKCGAPFVTFNDSGGARIQEGIDALSGYGRIFYRNVLLSGVVPQIAIIAGPCAGGAAYSPALMDFIIMVRGTSEMFITGPEVLKQVTGEVVTSTELGGPDAQMSSGVAHFVAESDADAVHICQQLLSFLPANNLEDPPDIGDGTIKFYNDPALDSAIPDDSRAPYDIKPIIERLVDNGELLEIHKTFAPNAVVGFARLNGSTIGVVANQPSVMAGVLNIDASDKIAGFVRLCNAFNVPLLTLIDVPGFLPGVDQERGGIIRHGAKMLFAYGAATVPKISLILRKAYGGAYLAMCGKDLGADRVAAWPTSEIAVMGPEGAVSIVFRDEIKKASNPAEARAEFARRYRAEFASPYAGAARNLIDDIIEPSETRRYLSLAFASLRRKRELRPQKKHGLMPL
ncbi:MAG: acyl-CoA carboxylase subunit beta [Candidatus Viridilinea halotolerans]|uniref:Acyl-CoA carboxylase subunit beta n=1 Tax=Candidatus Viridilinea halotolerans TaxID=2491704 RepID=A0A426TR87_9CHLR|nr:MAG: acyl-CoA carboxylase subunit beta [Candidatus Viridilinea halotolerans]